MHIISRDPLPPPIEYVRSSGGMFLDMMIHDFDMARFLTGDEVEEVYAAAGVMVDPAIGERATWTRPWLLLRFATAPSAPSTTAARRCSATTSAWRSWAAKARSPRRTAIPNQVVVSTGKSVYSDLPLNFFMDRYTESFALELGQFTQAVLEASPRR